ncbi:hypothetical protein pb186bvf_010699 [Paramecium bursaria]
MFIQEKENKKNNQNQQHRFDQYTFTKQFLKIYLSNSLDLKELQILNNL